MRQGKKEELRQLLSRRLRTVLAEHAADAAEPALKEAALRIRREASYLAAEMLEELGFEQVAMVMGWRKMTVKR